MKDYALLQKKHLVPTFASRGLILIEGDGPYLIDSSGEKYLDFMTNYGVNIFGHGHPEITRSLVQQIQRLTTLHGSFASDVRAEAARELVVRCGGGLSHVYFSNSGAESNEAALKFAVLATGRKKFVACRGGYHGKTLGALSATWGAKYRAAFEPLLWEFKFVDYNSPAALEEAVDEATAGFLVEPIQGESGVRVPDPGYLKLAQEICQARQAFLIVDEIQTGAGRTGHFLASQPEHISYDIVCLGKGLAGGIPVGATLVSEAVAEKIPRSSHTSTFGGNPLATAGILATLKLLDLDRLRHSADIGGYFLSGLKSMRAPLVREARGRGLMLGLEVSGRRDDILKGLQREKLLAIPAGDEVVRFLPPYIVEKEHVDLALEKIDRVVSGLSKNTQG
jgi:acetylornithine/succinyldiaminopimelate/putrescine aminotransferase